MDINLKFESSGKIIETGRNKDFRLLDIEGIETNEYELITSSNVNHDGSGIDAKSIKSKPIMAEIKYVGKDKAAQRSNVISFFNIHNKGKLTAKINKVEREISYNIEGFNINQQNINNPLKFLVSLYCPKPFWLGISEQIVEMADWVGGLRFPIQLPMKFAGRSTRSSTVVENKGDVPTPITIEFFGPATDPRVINTDTGEFIQVNKSIAANEKLIITTEFGNKKVILENLDTEEQTNAFGYIDLDSTFFYLKVGNNLMNYSADTGIDNAMVWIKWRNRYLGV